MSSRLSLVAAAFAVGAMSVHATAIAAEPYELVYSGETGCPSEKEVRADVVAHVRNAERAAGATMNLRVQSQDDGFSGEIVATDAAGNEGRRVIQGRTCAEVTHALAFLAAIAIELGGHIESESAPLPPPPPPKPPAPPPPPKPPAPPSPPPPLPPPTPSPVGFAIAGMGGVRGGIGPGARPTGELRFEMGDMRARSLAPWVGLSLIGGLSEIADPRASARLVLVGGRVAVCPLRFGTTTLALRPCAGLELGAVSTTSHVAPNPENPSVFWASAEVTMRLQWFFAKHVYLELEGGPLFPLLHTHYFFDPDETVYIVPSVTGRGAIGLGVRF